MKRIFFMAALLVTMLIGSSTFAASVGTWSSAGNMSVGRDGHTATLLNNGKALVVGGVGDGQLSRAELFDPTADTTTTSAFSSQLQQKLQDAIVLFVGSSKAYVNNMETAVDSTNAGVYPFIKDGRTLVPVRFISEGIGAPVEWDETQKKVDIILEDEHITFAIGSNKMSVISYDSGKEIASKTLDVPAQIVNGRTFIPLRALVEALGKQVFWDDSGLIVISDNENLFDQTTDKGLVDELAGKFENKQDSLNGLWISTDTNKDFGTTLEIKNYTNNGFDFEIDAFLVVNPDNVRTGVIKGKANLKENYFEFTADKETEFEEDLTGKFTFSGDTLTVEYDGDTSGYAGAYVQFSTEFKRDNAEIN